MNGWKTYSVKMDKMVELRIKESGTFSFAWKMDQFDANNKLIFKHSHQQESLEYTTDWKITDEYIVNKDDVLSWYLPNTVCQAWFAFPTEKINVPPSLISLTPDKLSPSEAGNIIKWTAKASDKEDAILLYKFLLNDSDRTTWTKENTWMWNTTEDLGTCKIGVQVRDENHAGPDGFDDCKSENFTIIYPKPICKLNAPDSTCLCSKIIASLNCTGNELVYGWSINRGRYILNSPNGNSISLKSNDSGPIMIIANATNHYGRKSNYSKSIDILPSDRGEIIYLDPNANLSEVIDRSENKTLCLEDGDYAGGLIIKTKNIKIKSKTKLGARLVDIEGLDLLNSSSGIIIFNSTYCDVKYNNISCYEKAGIHIELSSHNNITYNNIHAYSTRYGAGYGFNITQSNGNQILNNQIITKGFAFAIDDLSYNNIVNLASNSCIYSSSHETACKIDSIGNMNGTRHCQNGPLFGCLECDQINDTNTWSCT